MSILWKLLEIGKNISDAISTLISDCATHFNVSIYVVKGFQGCWANNSFIYKMMGINAGDKLRTIPLTIWIVTIADWKSCICMEYFVCFARNSAWGHMSVIFGHFSDRHGKVILCTKECCHLWYTVSHKSWQNKGYKWLTGISYMYNFGCPDFCFRRKLKIKIHYLY